MVKKLLKIFQSGDDYFIENTKDWDEERWFQGINWNKDTDEVEITNDFYSESSLKNTPQVVPNCRFVTSEMTAINLKNRTCKP